MRETDRRFDPRHAGGTPGGGAAFFAGLALMLVGIYLFLKSIYVSYGFWGWGTVYSFGGWHVSGGAVLFPAMLGVGLIFFNGRSILGWLLAVGSVLALCAGVIMSLHFSLAGMPLFDLLVILGIFAGGAGLFARSLRGAAPRR
jgi:hypothetical protein